MGPKEDAPNPRRLSTPPKASQPGRTALGGASCGPHPVLIEPKATVSAPGRRKQTPSTVAVAGDVSSSLARERWRREPKSAFGRRHPPQSTQAGDSARIIHRITGLPGRVGHSIPSRVIEIGLGPLASGDPLPPTSLGGARRRLYRPGLWVDTMPAADAEVSSANTAAVIGTLLQAYRWQVGPDPTPATSRLNVNRPTSTSKRKQGALPQHTSQ